MERITQAMVDNLFVTLCAHAEAKGMDTTGWRMQSGSKTFGNSFHLYVLRPGETGHYSHPFGAFLGMTKREAYDSLSIMRRVLVGM